MCEVEGSNVVDLGIDLSEFYMSVEWDILEVPAVRSDAAKTRRSKNIKRTLSLKKSIFFLKYASIN